MHIAIQGAKGSFHHQAAMAFDPDVDILSCATFSEVFAGVADGAADFGLVAIENNLHGSINEVYRLLERREVWITGDVRLHISQNLIGHSGITLEQLTLDPETRVLSQGPALAQVEIWLDEHLPNAHREETHDTAESVRMVMENDQKNHVAVAGKFAADVYDGTIICSDIQDDPHNYTRFILFQRIRSETSVNASHASVILKTDHTPGALLRALQVFALHKANLTKLDSHPIPGDNRHYAFYIDYELPANQSGLLDSLRKQGCDVKLLGEYSSQNLKQKKMSSHKD